MIQTLLRIEKMCRMDFVASLITMTDLNTACKRKDRFRLYYIVENDFAKTVTTCKWKLGSTDCVGEARRKN